VSAAQNIKAESVIVTIAHVSKVFGAVKALNDVSLSVAAGTVQCLIGPPGAGKSTLLRCISQHETIDRGAIRIDGALIEPGGARPCIATDMVSQRPDLFDHLTVLQHIIEGPLAMIKQPRRQAVAEAMAALERVGLADRRDSYPGELSGGQRQRVAIARVVAARSGLMLFDEPTAGIDPEAAGEVLDVLSQLAVSGLTMIVATHELNFVREVAEGVAFMAGGEIVEQGPPRRVLVAPEQARTRDFLATLLA
jgi:polar amino acid transport system ATP-binding protein